MIATVSVCVFFSILPKKVKLHIAQDTDGSCIICTNGLRLFSEYLLANGVKNTQNFRGFSKSKFLSILDICFIENIFWPKIGHIN